MTIDAASRFFKIIVDGKARTLIRVLQAISVSESNILIVKISKVKLSDLSANIVLHLNL